MGVISNQYGPMDLWHNAISSHISKIVQDNFAWS